MNPALLSLVTLFGVYLRISNAFLAPASPHSLHKCFGDCSRRVQAPCPRRLASAHPLASLQLLQDGRRKHDSLSSRLQATSGGGKSDSEDDEGVSEPGMADAFRQLESLDSLGDDGDNAASKSEMGPKKKPIEKEKNPNQIIFPQDNWITLIKQPEAMKKIG